MLPIVQNGFDQETVDALRPAERVVAQYLLEAGPEALVMSAAALAQRLGTSDATVVRTARSLGFSGLGELRRTLASRGSTEPRLAERLHRTLTDTPADALLANGIANLRVGLQSLDERIAPQQFQRAVSVLASRERVVWRGVGPSACLADYGRLLCERVGKKSSSLVHTGTSFADELLGLDGEDAVVLLLPQIVPAAAQGVSSRPADRHETAWEKTLKREWAPCPARPGAPRGRSPASHATTLVVLEAGRQGHTRAGLAPAPPPGGRLEAKLAAVAGGTQDRTKARVVFFWTEKVPRRTV